MSANFDLVDPGARKWDAKIGKEADTEVAASRSWDMKTSNNRIYEREAKVREGLALAKDARARGTPCSAQP